MALTTIITLIAIAVILLLIEIFLIPGTGIVGIIGIVILLIGIYAAWANGTMAGYTVLGGTVLITGGLVWLSLRSSTWDRFALHDVNEARVREVKSELKVGDRGESVSRITPVGNARFGENYVEVSSEGNYIEEHQQIEIVKLETNKIIVKPIKQS